MLYAYGDESWRTLFGELNLEKVGKKFAQKGLLARWSKEDIDVWTDGEFRPVYRIEGSEDSEAKHFQSDRHGGSCNVATQASLISVRLEGLSQAALWWLSYPKSVFALHWLHFGMKSRMAPCHLCKFPYC